MKLSAPRLLFLAAAMAAVLTAAASPLAEQSWSDLQATKAARNSLIQERTAQVTEAQNAVKAAEFDTKQKEFIVQMTKAIRKELKKIKDAYAEYPQAIADAKTAFEELGKALGDVGSGDTDQQAELQTLKTWLGTLQGALDALTEAWNNFISWPAVLEQVEKLQELFDDSFKLPEVENMVALYDPKIIGALSHAFVCIAKCGYMGEAIATSNSYDEVAENIADQVTQAEEVIQEAKDELTQAQEEAESARQNVPAAEEAVKLAQQNLQLAVDEENSRSAAAAAAACIAGL